MTNEELIEQVYAAYNRQDADTLLSFVSELSIGRTDRRDCMGSRKLGCIGRGDGRKSARATKC
jgi:hypothetical protein